MMNHSVTATNAKTRILYVHYGDNWLRGSEIVLLDLLRTAKKNNYTPVLWCNSTVLAEQAQKLGVEVIVDDLVCLGYWTQPKWNFIQFFKQMKKAKQLILDYKIAMVHCNNGAPCQWMSPICKLLSIPLLLHLHARYQFRDRLTLLFHCADSIVGVSHSVIDVFKNNENLHQNVSVIYNGIEPLRVLSPFPRDIRTELSANKDDFVMLYIGSLIQRKSIDQILHAMAQLKDRYSIKLAIVGSGEEQEKLTCLVKQLSLQTKVRFLPASNKVADLYSSNADCFISVPNEEVFGLTLAEASIAKLAVITTDIPGINEIYSDKKNALLVSPNNPASLSQAIASLIKHPELKNKLALNAHQHILQNFSLTQQFSAFDQRYQAQIKQKISENIFISFSRQIKLIVSAVVHKCFKGLIVRASWGK